MTECPRCHKSLDDGHVHIGARGWKVVDKIKPALTAEEWDVKRLTTFSDSNRVIVENPVDRHALAALALYGQPFGFSREDIVWLRDDVLENAEGGSPEYVEWLRSLIDRIEALLRPE